MSKKTFSTTSYWNHRVLVHESGGELFFVVHEVYYDDDNVPHSYTQNGVSIGGDSLAEIGGLLTSVNECLKKPALWYGDKFPSEYRG